MANFSERLSQLQSEKNYLKKDIAAAIGVSSRQYKRYENGEQEPTIGIAIALANFYGVSLDYLTGRVQKDYLTLLEEAEDEYLLAIAEERLKNDNGVRISFEEHLAKRGLTIGDIEKMEDVEIE